MKGKKNTAGRFLLPCSMRGVSVLESASGNSKNSLIATSALNAQKET